MAEPSREDPVAVQATKAIQHIDYRTSNETRSILCKVFTSPFDGQGKLKLANSLLQAPFHTRDDSLHPSGWFDEVPLFNFQDGLPTNLKTAIEKSDQEVKKHRRAFISAKHFSCVDWALTAHIQTKMQKYKLARLLDLAKYISCTQAVSKKQLAALDVTFVCIRTVQPGWSEDAIRLMLAFSLEVYTAIDHLLERFGRRPRMEPGGLIFTLPTLPTLPNSRDTITLTKPLSDSEQYALEQRIDNFASTVKPGSQSDFVEYAMNETTETELVTLLDRLFHEAHMLCLRYERSVYGELRRLHLQTFGRVELVKEEKSEEDPNPDYDSDETIDEMNPTPEQTEHNFSDSMLGTSGNCENRGRENIKLEMIQRIDESSENRPAGEQHQDTASDTDDNMNEMPDPPQQPHAANQRKQQNSNPSLLNSSSNRVVGGGNAHPGSASQSNRSSQLEPQSTEVDISNVLTGKRKRHQTENDEHMVNTLKALTKEGEPTNRGRMMGNGRIFKKRRTRADVKHPH